MRKFTDKILKNQLNATQEEINTILEYQETFPILSEIKEDYDETMCVVSARDIHCGLELSTRFNDWMKRMIKYGFEENIDYILVTQKRVTNNPKNPYTNENDYILTINMAKELCMIQRNEKGRNARKYFILMEKFVKNKIVWEDTRELAKGDFKELSCMFSTYMKDTLKISPKFSNIQPFIADACNVIATGKTAKEIEIELGLHKNETRDNLETEYNLRLDTVQRTFMTLFRSEADVKKVFKSVYEEVEYRHNVNYRDSIYKLSKYNFLFDTDIFIDYNLGETEDDIISNLFV